MDKRLSCDHQLDLRLFLVEYKLERDSLQAQLAWPKDLLARPQDLVLNPPVLIGFYYSSRKRCSLVLVPELGQA